MTRTLPLLLAALAALTTPLATASAAELPVRDAASFAAAAEKAGGGDTVRLADGDYPALEIAGRTYGTPVHVTGGPGARLGGLTVRGSGGISLEGFTLAPRPGQGTKATLLVKGSSDVVLDGLHVDGTGPGALVDLKGTASRVTVTGSEFTACGSDGTCLRPGAVDTVVRGNAFHDCVGCDFVSAVGAGVTIEGNTFDRALRGSCTKACPHTDQVQVLGGGPWRIAGNRFGDRGPGAAAVYVSAASSKGPRIDDVAVLSNLFAGDGGLYAVRVNGSGSTAPQRVSIVNNTMLAGTAGGVFLPTGWGTVAAADRPLVANNVMAVSAGASCAYGRYVSNLAVSGKACSASDEVGAAELDASGRPTARSTRIIDRADASLAPPTDIDGRARVGAPDRGAFEYRP